MAVSRVTKDTLNHLFLVHGRPAIDQLRSITDKLAGDLQGMAEPYRTLGQMVSLHWVGGSERSVDKLGRELQGMAWGEADIGESFRQFIYEMDVKRQKPEDLHWAFYFSYVDYQMLLAETKRVATLLEIDLEGMKEFVRWSKLDDDFTLQLREVLAMPTMSTLRLMLDDVDNQNGSWIQRWR